MTWIDWAGVGALVISFGAIVLLRFRPPKPDDGVIMLDRRKRR